MVWLCSCSNLGAWKDLEDFITLGQDTYQTLKYCDVPVVAASAGLCLGGGAEVLMHCDAVQAHAESYVGLVEVGVGLSQRGAAVKSYWVDWKTTAL